MEKKFKHLEQLGEVLENTPINYEYEKVVFHKLDAFPINNLNKKKKKVNQLLLLDKQLLSEIKSEAISVDAAFAVVPRESGCYQFLTIMAVVEEEVLISFFFFKKFIKWLTLN